MHSLVTFSVSAPGHEATLLREYLVISVDNIVRGNFPALELLEFSLRTCSEAAVPMQWKGSQALIRHPASNAPRLLADDLTPD